MLSDLRYPALHFPVTQTASVKGWLPTWNTSIRQWTSYWKEVGHWGVPLKEILEAARPLLLACPEVIKSPIYHMLLPQYALPQAQDMRQGNLGLKSLKSWVQISFSSKLTYPGYIITMITDDYSTTPRLIFANTSDSVGLPTLPVWGFI